MLEEKAKAGKIKYDSIKWIYNMSFGQREIKAVFFLGSFQSWRHIQDVKPAHF